MEELKQFYKQKQQESNKFYYEILKHLIDIDCVKNGVCDVKYSTFEAEFNKARFRKYLCDNNFREIFVNTINTGTTITAAEYHIKFIVPKDWEN